MKSSVSALMLTGLIVLIGFFATDMNAPLQFALNPFQYFRIFTITWGNPAQHGLVVSFWCDSLELLVRCSGYFDSGKETGLFSPTENKKPFNRGKTKRQRLSVWNICVFEWRKMRRNGLLKQLYTILALLIVFGYFVISQQAQEKEKTYLVALQEGVQGIEYWITNARQKITFLQDEKINAEKSGDEFISERYSGEIEVWERIESYYH